MKRVFFILAVMVLLIPASRLLMQDTTPPRVEITGVNPTQLPTVTITANVFDRVGQPVFGLTKDNFVLTGELADKATITKVENISDSNLSFSVVLAIDTSSSMGGIPLQRAQEAAKAFINSITANDPSVAIVTFSTNEHLVQDFTTDKNLLLKDIDNLVYGGKTALYDGSLLAIQTAAKSASPRRAVIILSDGAEFGNRSTAERGDPLATALKLGVPVYTIGLGYGIDRSFLKELADGTNAKNYESPSPEQLLQIYQGLAATLQSQYVITATVNVPADGTTYQIGLQTTTADGSASATADLRAPIPVPIVSLPAAPTAPISQPTDITATVKHDDPITSAEFQINGTTAATLTAEPYTITIDPLKLQPGSYSLTFNATDSTGDVGTASEAFDVAALPSTVSIQNLPAGDISKPQTVTLDVTGQTPATSATYSVDKAAGSPVTTAPFSFTIDPYQYAPGSHTLGVDVTNQGGATAHVEAPFSVAMLPPVVNFGGVTADQMISTPTTVTASVAQSQVPTSSIDLKIGDKALITTTGTNGVSATIDPMTLQPGKTQLTATVTDNNGQTSSQSLNIEIAALPPQISVSGLTAGETLDQNRTVHVDVASQTDVTGVTYKMDGKALGSTQTTAPYSVDLDVLALGPGGHILTVTVTNAGKQTATDDIAFVVAQGPSLTATATLWTSTPLPTNTPKPTSTPQPSNTPKPTNTTVPASPTPAPTSQSASVNTAEPESTSAVIATTNTPPSVAISASNTPAPTNTTAPSDTPSPSATPTTNPSVITATAQAAAEVIAEQTNTAQVQSMLTQQAISAANAQATVSAQQTAEALGTQNAQATQTAIAAVNAQGTQSAQATANAEGTRNAAATANALSTQNAQATLDARGTQNAQSTRNAQATLTAAATEATAEATAEQTTEPTEVSQVSTATERATAAITPTGTATITTNTTPEPTLTTIPLTAETQSAATNNNILPIAIICVVGLLVLLVVFLFTGGRRRTNNQNR